MFVGTGFTSTGGIFCMQDLCYRTRLVILSRVIARVQEDAARTRASAQHMAPDVSGTA